MENTSTHMGKNRTGMQASPEMAELMKQGAKSSRIQPSFDYSSVNRIRQAYYEETESVGSIPPPPQHEGNGQGRRPDAERQQAPGIH